MSEYLSVINYERVITDSKGPLAKLIDFGALKFRERDDLEFVFKFWRDSKKPFDAKALWDHRLRSYLKRFEFFTYSGF